MTSQIKKNNCHDSIDQYLQNGRTVRQTDRHGYSWNPIPPRKPYTTFKSDFLSYKNSWRSSLLLILKPFFCFRSN